MTPTLEAAFSEVFVSDSSLAADVRGLMELAVRDTMERCARISDGFGRGAGNDAAGGIAHAIGQQIRAEKP